MSLYIYALIWTYFLQSTTAQCTNRTSCSPPNLLNTSLVQCINSQCVCSSECFELSTTNNTCILVTSPCYAYSPELDQCQSSTPSWSTALLLSLLFGTTGADNFYINRLDFAIPQLLLFLSPLCGCFTVCTYCACTVFMAGKRKLRPLAHCMHCSALILASLAAIILPLTTISWNLADIFSIAFNEHFDSNGCRLRN